VDKALAVADGPALKGTERKRLLRVLSDLSEAEGGGALARRRQAEEERIAQQPFDGRLGEEDERLVTELRDGLAKLAGSRPGEPAESAVAVQGALDGAEFVVRGDLLSGRSGRIPQLLPSFVFLVLLPLLGKPEALGAAERAARLLDRSRSDRDSL
jgi:hypothetical protein